MRGGSISKIIYQGETKTCLDCLEFKAFSEFYNSKSNPDGLDTKCRSCQKRRGALYRQEHKEEIALARKANPRKIRSGNLLSHYGIDADQFDALAEIRDNCCSICQKQVDKLYVDHDHATNTLRGLLCHHCNLGLGHFFDKIEVLKAAATYLENTNFEGVDFANL